ncbi:MAG: LysM peptidoglycan-binding domain-containing protein, partial [Bacilli bacterium]|nr:LysM peptidoglycan-binding domain-containing protein [Bacilli bacterium]
GIVEKDLNLSISQYMANRFEELGIPFEMTRTTDETLSPTERVNRVLNAFGARPNVIVISNHINAGGGDGAEVVYPLRNNSTLPDLILREIAKTGQNVRRAYQRRLPSDTSQDYYFMQRETKPTQAITVEYGFLDSTADDVVQLKNFSNDYAEAVVQAVAQYLKLPYTPPIGANVYVVQSGDSLWSIARKLNVTVEELKAANNLTSNLLSVGQVLRIPQMEEPPVSGEYVIYTVKAGDSLYAIARQYNTTVAELLSFNNLSTANLQVGQQILIPSEAAVPPVEQPVEDYLTYRVQAGDNLYAIARKYNTTATELMRINNLSSNLLSVGQEIRIRVNEPTEPGVPSPNYIDYIVKSGDNLYDIAKRYNTTVSEIRSASNLTSNSLSIGQRLRIPVSEAPVTYIVKSGDNLYAIARQFNTTVDEIKKKNNLTSNSLSIGQMLII